MATESIFRTIKVETPEEIEKFARALEQAEAAATDRVDTSDLYRDATEEDINAIVAAYCNV